MVGGVVTITNVVIGLQRTNISSCSDLVDSWRVQRTGKMITKYDRFPWCRKVFIRFSEILGMEFLYKRLLLIFQDSLEKW